METITLGQLLEAVQGTLLGEFDDRSTPISRVDTDSRSICPGSLFIPLAGERFDGHAYLNAALESGAAGCLTSQERDRYLPGKFYVKVDDTLKALRDLAAWYKGRFNIPFIAVTGSVGKTTAKDMLAAVLGVKYKVLKTEGNFNNAVGLPLTLLHLSGEDQAAVIEMGMDGPGQIDYLADIVKPDVGIITNIGDAHIERLGSRENIFKAKCELIPHIKQGGLLVLNGDDSLLTALRGHTPVPAVFCGQTEGCDYRAQPTGGDGLSHIHCRLTTPNMDQEVKIPALGDHMIYPALIAAAVGERFGLTADEIELGLGQFVPTRMRMNVLRRGEGITILDDTYNANPQSMRAAISVLADSQGSFKAAILGDMLELGPFAPALHSGVGECLGNLGIDCLLAVGKLAEHIAQGAQDSGVPQVLHCQSREEAKVLLPQIIRPDSTILLKGSRGMKLEELTASLLELTREV
ncbi:UDP-N-acetylmuramoyl-tripeptide--D-alanyl-D-alanine ligase [Pseudoflavonifractor sp. 60]|uniref:UDP-N-acetylmuramoyl-tripeptide--D-alanyl-D- alanine ligase n=1 Tax=Pseudoflavonifractor sp. 60 TaxID=2304576 RepID=UPI001370A14D|nr:UDP-N-acetylmuramoyl-tripeptide--D-alanyl-D-alanine ligase [Pseudoflavonifractor sp. 60]